MEKAPQGFIFCKVCQHLHGCEVNGFLRYCSECSFQIYDECRKEAEYLRQLQRQGLTVAYQLGKGIVCDECQSE